MKIRWLPCLFVLVLAPGVFGDEHHHGRIGTVSSGVLNVRLTITEDIRAGLVRRNGSVGNELRSLISSGLVRGLDSSESATMSLCVLSTGGGTFEVTSYELPGQNNAFTQYGEPVSLQIGFGKDGEESLKMRASEVGCNPEAVVPVTVHLEAGTGAEVGRIQGRLKLLVKSE